LGGLAHRPAVLVQDAEQRLTAPRFLDFVISGESKKLLLRQVNTHSRKKNTEQDL